MRAGAPSKCKHCCLSWDTFLLVNFLTSKTLFEIVKQNMSKNHQTLSSQPLSSWENFWQFDKQRQSYHMLWMAYNLAFWRFCKIFDWFWFNLARNAKQLEKMSTILSTTESLRASVFRHVLFDNFKNFRTFWWICL